MPIIVHRIVDHGSTLRERRCGKGCAAGLPGAAGGGSGAAASMIARIRAGRAWRSSQHRARTARRLRCGRFTAIDVTPGGVAVTRVKRVNC
ncbi:hypothetical protein [Actinomadura sp.]|uniref:hypothetical protein n=1 Tax=Actinomadura sp. TaxID=1989 RepID=UPI0037C937DE